MRRRQIGVFATALFLSFFPSLLVAEGYHSLFLLPQTRPITAAVKGRMFDFFDNHGNRVTRCFAENKPMLVVVGQSFDDKAKLEKFYKDFYTQLSARHFLEDVTENWIGAKKGPAADPPKKKSPTQDVKLVVLLDPRALWDEAFAQGWEEAPQTAREEYPVMSSAPLLRGIFWRRLYPNRAPERVAKRVNQKLNEMYYPGIAEVEKQILETIDAKNLRIGALYTKETADRVFPYLLPGSEPAFRVVLVNPDGEVARQWTESEIDGYQIASVYSKAISSAIAAKKLNGNDTVCDSRRQDK